MKWIVILLVVIVAGAVGSYWYEGYSAESKLLEQPVYRVLKKHEPAVFDKLVDEYKLYAREETRRENFINLANSEISLARHAESRACLAGLRAGAHEGHDRHRASSAAGAGRCVLPLLVSAGRRSSRYRQIHR